MSPVTWHNLRVVSNFSGRSRGPSPFSPTATSTTRRRTTAAVAGSGDAPLPETTTRTPRRAKAPRSPSRPRCCPRSPRPGGPLSSRDPISKAREQHIQTVTQPCMWYSITRLGNRCDRVSVFGSISCVFLAVCGQIGQKIWGTYDLRSS